MRSPALHSLISSEQSVRRQTVIVFLMSLTTTLAWWGISTWVPPYIGSVAAAGGMTAPEWASYAGMAYTAGSVVGYISFGFVADAYGRRPTIVIYMALALVLPPVLFLWTRDLSLLLALAFLNAIFSNGQCSWMPSWLPELYPTRMRATAIAFAFNAPRFIALLGPIMAGTLIVYFGGFGYAARSLSPSICSVSVLRCCCRKPADVRCRLEAQGVADCLPPRPDDLLCDSAALPYPPTPLPMLACLSAGLHRTAARVNLTGISPIVALSDNFQRPCLPRSYWLGQPFGPAPGAAPPPASFNP
jgi:MFS family permease